MDTKVDKKQSLEDQIEMLSAEDVQRQLLLQTVYLKEQLVSQNKKLDSLNGKAGFFVIVTIIGFFAMLYIANQ